MFGFGKPKEDPNRKALREEFERTVRLLKNSDEMVQIAVGHAINMANSLFHKSFNSHKDYLALPMAERISFIYKFSAMEDKLHESGDINSAIGTGLFKMWVGALAEEDGELLKQIGRELSFFGKKGNFPT